VISGGLRNLAGHVSDDGTLTLWATTATSSTFGDNGADPNAVVRSRLCGMMSLSQPARPTGRAGLRPRIFPLHNKVPSAYAIRVSVAAAHLGVRGSCAGPGWVAFGPNGGPATKLLYPAAIAVDLAPSAE
jgi:hypothetical protein